MDKQPQFVMLHTTNQWQRCAHTQTVLDSEQGEVQLAWQQETLVETTGEPWIPAGLAFDPWCRFYHSQPDSGQILRYHTVNGRLASEGDSLIIDPSSSRGSFNLVNPPRPLQTPVALAVDAHGHLFVAEATALRLQVYDLTDNRLVRTISLPGQPIALTSTGTQVWCIVEAADTTRSLYKLTAQGMPRLLKLCSSIEQPGIIASSASARVFLIDRPGSIDARLLTLDDPENPVAVPWATGLVVIEDEIAVVALAAGSDFRRFRMQAGAISELPFLNANGYDGRGIAVSPEGIVVYWQGDRLGRATLARVTHVPTGRIVSYRLDSGTFQNRWGRVFVDACLPEGSQLSLRFIVTDDPPDGATVPPSAPDNTNLATIQRPDLSPPLPPVVLVNAPTTIQTLHPRGGGNELPWQCEEEEFLTYEAPVNAGADRDIWVIVDLSGKSYASPKLRSIRIHYPDRNLLQRLPRNFSADENAANFLRRHLAIADDGIHDIDKRATARHMLMNPDAAPSAVLPWLGSLLGVEVDQRWPDGAKREVIRQAAWLFRFRGTVPGLKRFLEIYLERSVEIVEHFKVRGLGGAFVGASDSTTANSVLGAGFRLGGQIGLSETQFLGDSSLQDAITLNAHRFSLIVPLILSTEQRAVIEHILDVHRPAHTIFDICSVDAGMRIGTGLHLGLTSMVGASSGFGELQLGGSVLGRSDTMGRAQPGTSVGNSRLGEDSRVG